MVSALRDAQALSDAMEGENGPAKGQQSTYAKESLCARRLYPNGQKWKAVTPAMAAGLTDHVWPLEALLSSRVPPKHVWY
jgi:hypothetical protein